MQPTAAVGGQVEDERAPEERKSTHPPQSCEKALPHRLKPLHGKEELSRSSGEGAYSFAPLGLAHLPLAHPRPPWAAFFRRFAVKSWKPLRSARCLVTRAPGSSHSSFSTVAADDVEHEENDGKSEEHTSELQ